MAYWPRYPMDPLQILFIEDDQGIVALLETLAAALGAKVHAVRDMGPAEAAIEGPAPDLVLLDIVLPSGNGLDLLRSIRSRPSWKRIPVLVVSARPAATQRSVAFELGADDYLEKPFDLEVLEAKLRSYLRMSAHCQSLARERSLLADIVDRLPSGLMVLDPDSRILYLNAAGGESLGLAAESVLGKALSQVLPTLGGVPQLRTERGEVVGITGEERGGGVLEVRSTTSDKASDFNDKPRDGSNKGHPLALKHTADQHEVRIAVGQEERLIGYTVSHPKAGGTIVVFRDLSTVERLRQAERGVARFVHELRNPLAAIQAVLTMIATREFAGERRNRLATAASDEAQRVVHLAEEYLARRKTRKGRRDGTSMGPLISEIIELNLLGVESPPQITSTCPGDLPRIRIDSARLRQIVLNLVLNSIEAMRGRSGSIEIRAQAEGNGVMLEVTDNGPGISAHNLPHIFEEHFTTRANGDGFGLAIVRQIVDEEGGWVKVQSETDVRTTFRVWLPTV